MVVNFNEFGIRILFQFFDDGMKDWHSLTRILGDVAHVLGRHEMHGHGNGCRRNPHMNVRAAGAVFVNIDADHAFPHGVCARENQRSANCESCFRK